MHNTRKGAARCPEAGWEGALRGAVGEEVRQRVLGGRVLVRQDVVGDHPEAGGTGRAARVRVTGRSCRHRGALRNAACLRVHRRTSDGRALLKR